MTDRDGNIARANVGWVRSDIVLKGHQKGTIQVALRYYFNPNPESRSLEPANLPRMRESE